MCDIVDDVLIEIFSLLNGKDMLECIKVCSNWRDCIENSRLSHQTFYVRFTRTTPASGAISEYYARVKGLSNLKIFTKDRDVQFISEEEYTSPLLIKAVPLLGTIPGAEECKSVTKISFYYYGTMGKQIAPAPYHPLPMAECVTFLDKTIASNALSEIF